MHRRRRRKQANFIDKADAKKMEFCQVTKRREKNRNRFAELSASTQPLYQEASNKTVGSRLKKMLVLPDKDKKVTEKMRKQKLKAMEHGVQNVIEFPSGAALLMIEEIKAEAARLKIANSQRTRAKKLQIT